VAKNYYFENFENSMEQTLIEDLVIESIKVYGMDVWYIPRTLSTLQNGVRVIRDDILNEDDLSTFNDAYMAEMYVKSVDGFEGEGDFLSKFGLEIRDSITMTIAKRTYESEIGTNESNTRPREGDLIYLPLNNKIFEIQHVEHESIFYQMGSIQMYDLRAELFEFSGERFTTGQKFIDEAFDKVDLFVPSDSVTYGVKYDNGFLLMDTTKLPFASHVKNLSIELEIGRTYVFDQTDLTNSAKRLQIYTTSDPSTDVLVAGQVTAGTLGGSGAKTTFTPTTTGTNAVAPGEYYYRTDDGTEYGTITLVASRIDNVEAYDALADNTTVGTFADNLIDFTETNPFGDLDL
jgi:hypothetical protein